MIGPLIVNAVKKNVLNGLDDQQHTVTSGHLTQCNHCRVLIHVLH